MRRNVGGLILVSALIFGSASSTARAQIGIGGPVMPYRVQSYYTAPGGYGTSYGVASYGMRQTYSTFSSSYGQGYSYGYPPVTYLPGRYGVGLWAPHSPAARGVWRSPYYGTFARPTAPANVPPPPIGVYAPAFGPGVPGVLYGW